MSEHQLVNLGDWYRNERQAYEGLTNVVQYLIESLIRNAGIDYLSVTSRTKSVDSFLEKTERKGYTNVAEITDVSGIRVITFIDSDVKKACDLIKSSFNVYPEKSLDKSDELGIDRFGYRSVHFVCDLGSDRIKLPEFALYKSKVFEIQVRTALQHAWAEIEHDRNYKFSGVLPTPIQRRMHMLAGVLEMVDREFVSIAADIDQYAIEVSEKTRAGNLEVELNSTSINQYLPAKLQSLEGFLIIPNKNEATFNQVIDELIDFGITTLADLDRILPDDFFTSLRLYMRSGSLTSILRKAMMYSDIDKYFDSAWNSHWKQISRTSLRMLKSKYGKDKVEEILNKHQIKPPAKSIRGRKRFPKIS